LNPSLRSRHSRRKAIDQVARRLSAAGESTENLNRALASYIQKHQGVSPCEEAPIDYAFWSSPESKQLWTRFEALRSAEPGPALRAFLNDLDRVPTSSSASANSGCACAPCPAFAILVLPMLSVAAARRHHHHHVMRGPAVSWR